MNTTMTTEGPGTTATPFDFALADSRGLFHQASVVLTVVLSLLGLVAVAALTYIGLRSSRAAAKLKAKLERKVSKRVGKPSRRYSRLGQEEPEGDQDNTLELGQMRAQTGSSDKASSGYALMSDTRSP